MAWWEVALQNPAENWPVWMMLLFMLFQTVIAGMKVVNALINNSTKVQTGQQAIITQDNSLQSKTLDEMAARRISDELFRNRLADILDGTVNRIDKTTIATHGEAKEIRVQTDELNRQMKLTQQAIKSMYQQLKKEGVLQ